MLVRTGGMALVFASVFGLWWDRNLGLAVASGYVLLGLLGLVVFGLGLYEMLREARGRMAALKCNIDGKDGRGENLAPPLCRGSTSTMKSQIA